MLSRNGRAETKATGIEEIATKHVLVTGGCGFIGVNLVADLLRRGAEVSVLDLPSANWSRLPEGVRTIKADILVKEDLVNAVDDTDIVYHLAARTDLDGSRLEDYKVNYEGTGNLVEAAAKAGVQRFVFYSTQLVVGLFNETRFLDETEPYRTRTPYGASKIEGERVVIARCRGTGTAYTIIRPTSVYGPWGRAPYRDFFRTIKRRRYFHIGKASNLVSLVYVKNLIDLTVLASLSDLAKDEIYFGNDFHPYTMKEFANSVAEYYGVGVPTMPSALATLIAYAFALPKRVGLNVPLYPFRLRNIKSNYCYDIGKSVVLGYRPSYGLGQGVTETLDWYERNDTI